MRYVAKKPQVFFYHPVAVHKGVAARYKHIVGLGVVYNVLDGDVQKTKYFLFGVSYHALSEAMSAVHCAHIGGKQQNGVIVFMLDSVGYGVVPLSACIQPSVRVLFVK